MIPDWSTKPEVVLGIALYLTAPFWTWFVGWVRSRLARRSELTARANLAYLQNKIEHPPTLIESLAFIICFLPIPFAMAMTWLLLYITPPPPAWLVPIVQNPDSLVAQLGFEFIRTTLFLVIFVAYAIFGTLTVHGFHMAYLLKDGAEHYADNYKAGIQKRINKLEKKYPQLK